MEQGPDFGSDLVLFKTISLFLAASKERAAYG
jgi:hypothetical protein